MSILSRLGAQARYNVLTPVFLLSLGLSAPALADNQDWVITTPQTNFILLENDALTNHSLINGTGGNPAIHGEGNVRFVNNTVAGQISSNGDGIYIEGSAGQIINAGSIVTASEAIEVDGDVGTLINSGDITSASDEAINIGGVGGVGTFFNSGLIASADGTAVYIGGGVGTFTNAGTIGGVATGVDIGGHVDSFVNSGEITSLERTGVSLDSVNYFLNESSITAETNGIYISNTANHFINSGLILSADDNAIEIHDVGRFENSGSIVAELDGVYIVGTMGSFRNSGAIFSNNDDGVYVGQTTGSFENSGSIFGDNQAVELRGNVGTFSNLENATISGDQGVVFGAKVGSFVNGGTISAANEGVISSGFVGQFANSGRIISYSGIGVTFQGDVGQIRNSGTIEGYLGGIAAQTVGLLTNSGAILSQNGRAIAVADDIGVLANSGLIRSVNDQAVFIDKNVGTFSNSATGTIISNGTISTAVLIGGNVDTIINAGSITGYNAVAVQGNVEHFENQASGFITAANTAVFLGGNVTTFANHGRIYSSDGVSVYIEDLAGSVLNTGEVSANETGFYFNDDVVSFINSGTIRSADEMAVYFDNDVDHIVNSGLIHADTYGLSVEGDVLSFVNAAGGKIAAGLTGVDLSNNIDVLVNRGHITSLDRNGIRVDGDVGTFVNNGAVGTSGSDYAAIYIEGNVGDVVNSGAMFGGDGIYVEGNASSISNMAGSFIAASYTGILIEGDVTQSFANHGQINAGVNGVRINGTTTTAINTGSVATGNVSFYFDDDVTLFQNSGHISTFSIGTYFSANAGTIINSGVIDGDDYGVDVAGAVETFNNSGTITGGNGVYLNEGGAYFTNSGTLIGTSGNSLIFNGDDNVLDIRSGARFVSDVDFGSGANTYLEASAYHGSIVIGDEGATLNAGNVRPGTNYYYQDPNFIYIVSDDFVRRAALPVASLAGGVADVLTRQLSLGDAITSPDDLAMNYAANPRPAAETATLAAIETGEDRLHVWSEALGGFGGDRASETAEGYAALVAGAHREVAAGLTLGAFAGAGHTKLDVANGAHVINGTVALAGVYGEYDTGVIRTDFSLIAGLSGNDSVRETAETEGPFVTTASYGGWFIAPAAGAYLPVLSSDSSEITIGGRLGYVAGGFGDYFEEGSLGGLYVGAQSYGILTALAEIKGETRVQDGLTLHGSAGVFARNHTGSDVEVFLPIADASMGISTAGTGAGLGVKAAIGAEMTISDALTLTAGVNGSWASNSGAVAAANLGLGGKF